MFKFGLKSAPASAGVFVIFACLFVYVSWPGLFGAFVLDDWPNLASLTNIDQQGFWSVVLEGVSSTLGRPLSLFTFALQAYSWPSDPFPFKIANLFIHLLNSALVFILSHRLYKLYRPSSSLHYHFALFASVLWLFLPLHASTTFYVVQRMTLLSATFSLLGVFAFAWGLDVKNGCVERKRVVSVSLLVAFSYLAGVLSKENAVLLAVFLPLCLIFLHFRGEKVPLVWKIWLSLFSLLPAAALVIYLTQGDRYLSGYSIRHFALDERLMTEARILWDYVFKTYFPSSHGLNIYNDGFPVSKSLLMPISTLLAIIGWGLVFVLAIIKRKQWPFFTFGALWFLGGHLLESTFLGLELYFEHRNYLPSFGLVLMVVGSIFHQIELFLLKHNKSYIDSVRQSPLVQMGVILLFFWLIWSALVLGREANSWSSARLMAAASLEDRPDSLRANQDAAAYYANVSDYRSSALVLHHIEQKWPGYAGTTAHKMLINCFDANVLLPPADESLARFRNGPMDRGAVPTLHEILRLKRSGSCQHFSWEDYRKFLVALQENSSFSSQKENVLILLAYSYNAQSLFKEAAEVLASGNLSKPSIGYMFLSAQFMAMAGNIGSAREITQQIRINYPVNSKPWILHSDKVELLEQQLDLSIE